MKILLHVTSEKIWPESGLSTVNITKVVTVRPLVKANPLWVPITFFFHFAPQDLKWNSPNAFI